VPIGLTLIALAACSSITSDTAATTVDTRDIILTNLSGDCADYAATYEADVTDVKRDVAFASNLTVVANGGSCSASANSIPNYDFDDDTANFATAAAEQDLTFSIPRNPEKAASSTGLTLLTYNAIMLNGVVLDSTADGCYSPDSDQADRDGNVAVGCGLFADWRLDPLGPVTFGTDSHNAHVQPGGIYHYHGNPMALFDSEPTAGGSPVIGFAADGYPIYGPYYVDDETGELLEATSGYTLKEGDRPTDDASPGGSYDGTYLQDYEFTDAGTLDECNGMTVDGQYGYRVTGSYPWVMACFTGTPDPSFFKFWSIAWWVIGGLSALLIVGVFFIVRRVRRARRVSA
jgi:hypothetical protein